MPSGEHEARRPRDFRDRPLGKIAVVAVLLLAIFLVSRGCQRGGQDISSDEAVVIATDAVDFVPADHAVRFQRRGTAFRPHWNVSLWQESETGARTNVTVVVVNAQTGEVVDIVREDQ